MSDVGSCRRRWSVGSVTALALAVAVVWSGPASAYRPPARALLERAAARQLERGTKALKVEADVQLYDAAGVAQGAPLTERTLVVAPGSMRREMQGTDGVKVEVRVDDKVSVRGPGQARSSARASVDVLLNQLTTAAPLEAAQSTERMLRDLRSAGVNTEVVSYARFDGRVSYLIGSKTWETDKSQLWIDKETLLITRFVQVSKATDGKSRRTDIRYLGWGSPVGGNWYPASIEVHVDDRLVKRSVVRRVERNIPVAATEFALP